MIIKFEIQQMESRKIRVIIKVIDLFGVVKISQLLDNVLMPSAKDAIGSFKGVLRRTPIRIPDGVRGDLQI